MSSFETYVGGRSYTINYGTGSVSESWGTGNDNLAFDDEGNLWINQDGGRGHLWVVRNGHTQASPLVELFAKTPAGSESTGLTFTPDKKFAFLSIQHPTSTNGNQTDAAGVSNAFNAAYTIVIARKENLGNLGGARMDLNNLIEMDVNKTPSSFVYPNPTNSEFNVMLVNEIAQNCSVQVYNLQGDLLKTIQGNGVSNKINLPEFSEKGTYTLVVRMGEKITIHKVIAQ